MALEKKYFSVTLPTGESRIVDADKIDQKRDWLNSHNAKVSEVNSFEITLPSGASKTVGPEEYESHIDWIKNHNATVKGSWVGAQQQSAPSARTSQQVRPPEEKRDPFQPTMELEGAMYRSAPKPIRESSSVSVPERREVTPQQRADVRSRLALGEPVIQRPNRPATSPVPRPGRVDFVSGHVYQVTTKNGDQIPVMIHPDADGVVDNGDGTVNVVVNGAEVDGQPVISQMSKTQLQGMFSRTVNNSARDAENQRAWATADQVRQLTADIDAGIQEISDIASGRFRDAVGKESFAERLNRMMPMTAGGPGPMAMPSTADPLTTLSQTEKDDYRALQAASRSVRDASRIIEEANHNAQSGTFDKWLERSFAGGVARGFGQKFFDLDTWDMGVSDIHDGAALLAALDAFDKGEPLTKAQQMLLDAKAVELATNAYFGSYVGRGYKAGSVTAESIPFMIEMCINPASSIGNAATNKMARYAIKRFGKQAAKRGIQKVVRGVGRAGADLAGATIMAGTTGLPAVAGEAMERMAGLNGDSVGYDEQGHSFFNGIRDGEAPVEAAAKAFGSRVIENYSEMVGEYFAPLIGGAGKATRMGLEKVHLGQVVDFLDNINASDLAKMVGDFERHAKWNGPIGEYAEEVTGGIMNALLVGDQTLDADPETGVFNLDNNIDTFLGVGLMGGFFGAVKTAGYRTPKYRAKNQLDRAGNAGKAVFRNPDDWTAFTAMFDSDPNAAVRDVLSGDFTQQERQAALNYAKASMEYQGALTADQKREVSPEQKDAETSFDSGYSLSTPSEMHDAKVALEARRAALRDTFGEDDITLEDLNVAEGAEGWTPEQKAVAMDYINAKATYDGMIQRVKDDIGNQTDQAHAEIDRNVNTDMNVVIPVTMADGRRGYIVRGNVSLGEDGRIDRSASDKAIIVRDAATGQNEWSTPALIVDTDGLIDPLSQKEAVSAQIREQVAQAEADKIDGRLQYAEGETRKVVTQDGQLAEMTVVPNDKGVVENEDGTVNVTISAPDGSTVREELTREQIAQAVDAGDAARLAQFDAQRTERAQAEAATADEALARYASIPQGSDIRVHWETGDATYRFEGARPNDDGDVVFDAVDPENESAGLIEIPATEVTNMDELLNAQPAPTVTENESVAGAPAQEPAVPVSGSGVKQYQDAPVEATYQDIYSDPSFETPEEAAGFISGKIARTEAALADAQKALDAVKPENYDTPADYKAARDAARQPVETARQTLDYWNAVRAYADSQAQPAPASEPVLTEKAGPSSAEMQRKLNLRKAVEAKRKKGNYSAELDEIGKDGQIGSFKDFIRQTLLRGQAKLLWSDSKDGVQKGLGSHLNKGAGEMRQRIWLLRNEDGKYPEQLADELLEAYAGELGVDTDNVAGGDATFALNALLEVLREEPTASMMFEKVKEEHKSLKESLDGDDRNRQAAYDEMMREMDEEARQAGMLLYDLLDYYDLHLDEKAREYSENYDEINAIFAEDQFDQYEQQLRESEEIHGRVPGEEGIRGSLEGGDALGEDAAEAPGRDSLRDLRGEDGGGEGNTGQARAGSVSDTPLEGAEEGAASEEVGDLPDFTGENPVVQAIDEAAAQVDTNPTDAQKEAGNYRKGHVTVDGYDISIENPKGSVRSGRDASGKEWSVTMNNNYGYIRRTEGVDGDHIDVFLSDDPTEGKVFVIDQVKPDGSFDEHKVMYGFGSAEEAREAYLANYSPGWTGLGTITEVSKEEFRKWIDSSHRKTKPFFEYKSVKKDGAQHGGIDLDAEAAAAVAFTTGRTAEDVAAEREEARRVPLRDRIHEWERQVGVKANIIESLDGVQNAAARRAIERGETISGWFEKGTGEVYVYLPGTADVSEVDRTYLHEVVAHKGVSEMLGQERFARLMDSVWNDVMSEKDRKEWTDYVSPDMNGRSEEDIRRAAADEYVANLAENLSTEDNRSAWDKFVAKVREILRDMGFDIKREDLQDILRESYERLRKEAARKTAKSEKAPAAKKLKDAKIEDFGQKIGGARKDQAREKIRDSFKLTAKDLLELKDPDKILSRKQIAKYLAEGQMTQGDAVMLLSANMAVRGATGMESFKTAMMMKYREMASAWEKGEDLSFDITDADVDYVFGQYPERIQQMPDIRSRIRRDFEHHLRDYNDYKRTYEALDYPNTARQIKSAYIREGRVDGKFWVVASPSSYRGWPFATFEEAVLKMKRVYPEVVNVEKEAKKAKDSGDVKTGHLKVVKDENGYYRVKSNLIPGQIFLSKRFYTRKQAEEYLNENAEALVEKETNMSYALMGSNIGMVQREGRDYRGGKDVNEKSFMETFAPRGVEFGNWVPQAERQEYLNKTYDAIMDFCEVVGISPKAFFLGGRLAVAFGARGKGGALAHYEPMKEVINLTRMKGAGSLAHEWFHALDNQLAKQKTGNTSDMATDTKNVVREEVAQAFREFVSAMNALDYSRRSRRAGAYWGEVWERAARLFADYTYNELGGKGIVSPLLARKPDEVDDQSEDFILSVWPYATKQENAAMKPYFDRLFAAIQEEEGTGVLFRKKDADHKKAQMDIISRSNPMRDDYHVGIRSVKDIRTLAEAVEEARKDARAGGWKELAAYPDVSNRTLEDALRSGRITVFSSYPIANGVFVTPSRMQAKDYAGAGEVYSKTVPVDNVAWINTDEGMFAQVGKDLSGRVAEARFRKSNRAQNIFVSNAEAAVASVPMEKATPEQWEKMIAGKGGLKAGEDKWIGLTDWLRSSRKKTISKQEVADYIAAHRIEIEEKHYTDDYREAIDIYSAGIADVLGQPVGGAYYGRYRNDSGKYELAINGPSADVDATYDMLMEKYSLDSRDDVNVKLWSKVSDIEMPAKVNDLRKQYTTAGLENKREIALTVPTIDPWALTDETHFGDAGKGRAIAWIRFGDTVTAGAGDADMSDLKRELAKKYNVPPYRLNEVASDEDKARIEAAREKQNEDYRNGVSGRRVLVIDEIQSNRHQEGREKGYKKPLTDEERERLEDIRTRAFHRGLMRNQAHQAYEDARKEIDEKYYRDEIPYDKYLEAISSPKIKDLYENYATLRREADDLRKEFQDLHNELLPEGAVPDAPFEKNWHELAFKRMLRYAAENGYDAVAWTTGDQQADRYNLGSVVQGIRAYTDPFSGETVYQIDTKSTTLAWPDIRLTVDAEGTIATCNNKEFVGKPLSDLVGKSLANRMLSLNDGETIEGEGLRIGGEGMKGFYDDILPRFVNKYAKKWSARVEDIQLAKVAVSARTIHSVRVTPEMKASVMEGQTMFRKANRTQNGFVSNAEAAVESIPMEKATPEQWEKMIAGKGGLKAGEDKWLGLTDWLRASRKKTLTKDEVMDFIAENRIQIEEEHYGELELESLQAEFDEIYDGLIDGIENPDEEQQIDYDNVQTWHDFSRALMNPKERAWDELRERYNGGDDFDMAFSLDDRMRIQVDNEDAAGYFLGVRPINYTRMQYTTFGLQNKREIALWVPDIEPWHESDDIHFGDAGEGRAVAWIRFGETTTRTPATPEEIDAYEQSQPKADQWQPFINSRGNTVYFPNGNRMSHDFIVDHGGRFTVYLNEIPLNTEASLEEAVTSLNHTKSSYAPNDLKSRKVLVIDEIQSNRHQEGREKGYFNKKESDKADEEALRPVREAENEFYDIVKELFGDKWRDVLDGEGVYPRYLETLPAADIARVTDAQFKRSQARNAYEDQRAERVMQQETRLIPDAPFEKNWHELAMKRMLRLAAEEGYDKLAWTTGEQQADRYDLSAKVDEIKVADSYNNTFTVIGIKDNGILVEQDVTGEHGIAEMIGKDLARKAYSNLKEGRTEYLNEDGAVSFSGDNLKIGGQGMSGFYDDILPRFMNKYAKKWGVKVEDVELSDLESAGVVMHSVDITPEMKASVMEGQTMFRRVPLNQGAREEAESIQAIGFLTGRLGLAPNGNRSRLSDENWALVRTPAFKRWFGDWERLHMLLNPVEARSTSEAAEMIRPLANQPLRNETLGITATISRNSLSKYTSEKATKKSVSPRLHAIAIANVKALFETAGVDVTHPDTKKRTEVAQTHRIGNAFFDRETGEWIPVMLTVIEYNTNDGNRIYSIEAVDLQKEKSAGQLVARASEDAEQTPIADFLSKIETFIGTIKDSAEKVSKVVDENGEPMVLFHQTEGDITEFDLRHPGAGTSDHMTPFGIFLKPTPNDIGLRGKVQIPLFASIRNPLVFESRTDLVRWLEENVPGYKADADRLKDIDWEYGRKNDKAWEADEKVFLDLREQRINGEITEEEFRRRFDEYQSESQKVLDEWSEASRELSVQMKDMIGTYLRGSGYDGVHIRRDAGSFGRVVETYIALEPSQVKSATDNNGNYDPDDPDTRFRKTVTPEQDAEYMDAVESGDMEKAQRMVREAAAATMPESVVLDRDDLPKKVLHGTNSEFNIFDERKIGSGTDAGWLGRGFYFYGNAPEYASQYGKRIIGAYLNIENPYFASVEDMDRLAEANSREASVEFRQELEDEGYDGVFYNGDLNEEWVAFYPNQIKSADPVTYDDLGNIVPLSNRFNPESNDIRFRKRTKPAPEKTGIGYKVFYQKDGKLYPPMVANPGGVDTPVGVWLDAEAAPVVGQTKTGRPQVKAGGKGTQGGSGTLAFRPGWHLGEIPYALQFGRLNPETGKKDLFPKDFVWAEVEYAADKSYQLEADANGMTEGGKYRHSYAGLKRLPEDGFYRYRTNPNPETDPWIITGSMKVNRVLSREEVDELVRKAGREPQKVEGDDTRLRKPEQKKTIPPLRRPAPAPEANAAALVRKVEGGGLRAILGDERTKEFYESVYQVATPEEVQALAEKSIQPGYDLSRAIKEYLADLAEKGFEDDGTGMLRNAAFRLSLQIDSEGAIGDNVLQYILWRNGRRYNKSDQVSEAANVNMKVRLKVGEYAGESLADKADKGTDTLEAEAKAARIKLAQEKKAATKKVPKTSSDLLEAVTKAMSAQREYDQATVDSIIRLAKTLIDEGGIDAVSAREMGRLLSIVSRANGKTTLQRSANQLVDFMARHILKRESAALEAMTKVKASKERQPGVDVQDKLDPEGQIVVKALKAYMQSSVEAIDRRTAELQDKRDKGKLARMEADAEIAGLALARDYVEKIAGAEQEEEDLKQAVKDARFDKHMTPKTYREFVDSTDKSIRENVIERIQALRDIRARLADVISASGERAVLWNQKEQERVDAIRYDANRDLEGMPAEEQGHERSTWDKLKESSIVQFLAAPLGTFDQMLRFLGRKSPDGRGYLFNRYMGAWNRSASEEWLGTQEADAILDAKVREIFGDEVKRWSDLYRIERRIDREHEKAAGAKHTLKFWDGTKMVEKELSSGNLLYVYMVDKMVDGQMKLRRMGITEEDVDRIKRELDPRFIQLADWIQEDFLVERRLKYDETHRRMFGSSMASIDNYFPLRVLANAREREEEVGSQPEGQQMPSKFTGSIIKRRRNSLALDIVGSDAFSVTVEHIREMERWSAWAEFKRDLGTLLSYRHFRNQLENMSTVYGSGKDMFNNFKKVCEIAAGEYRPEGRGAIDKTVTNLVRGVSSAKVSFRVFTALKQTLSLPAFLADARADLLAKSMFTPGRSWQWCMDNLPVFQKRWRSKQAGNEKLQDSELDWSYWRKHWMQLASRWGMSPNAFVDALTVSVGSYAVYQTRLQQYLEDGYTQEMAEEKAKQDATVSFNESQQSSEGAFMSALQSDRTVVANALSVFRNSSFGYGRRFYAGARNIGRMLQPGYRQESVEFMKRQFMNDGLEEGQAQHAAERAYRRAFAHGLLDMAVFGFGVQLAWNLGPYAVYMLLGGGDDDKWWNGKKKEDLTDAVMHALVGGWTEGLSGGSVVSEMINMARKGESFRSYDPTLLPALSDLKRIAKTFENDKVAGSVDVVNLLVQSGFGFNPETVTDVFVSLYDACNGDLGLAKESLIAAMRILQVPQSQVDQFLLDELDLTNEEYDDTRLPEIAERYARYMITRGAPGVERMYSEPLRQKLEKKYIKRFEDKAKVARKVRGSGFDREFLSYLDDDYKQTKSELQELKESAAVEPDEYARILDEFYASPEFREYKLADLIRKTRKDIGKIEKGSRNRTELIKRLNDYKTEFLELRRKEGQGDKR